MTRSATLPGGDEAAVVHVVHQRRPAGEPMHRLLERHDLLLAHPVPQQIGAVFMAVGRMRTRAAIARADHRVGRAEDLLLRRRIGVAIDADEEGLQILIQRQIEERIHHALALLLGDLRDALALEPAVPLVLGHEDLHQVPAPVEEAARATAPVGAGPLLRDGALHRLGAQRLADLRIAERAHPLLVRQRHDLVPGRHAGEQAVRIGQVLILRHIEPEPQIEDRPGDDGDAGAVAAGARVERVLQPAQMLLPFLGPFDRLGDEIVDGRATGPGGKVAGHLARRLGAAGSAARDLHDAGPQFAEHIGECQALRVGADAGGIAAAQRRGAEAERAGVHARR